MSTSGADRSGSDAGQAYRVPLTRAHFSPRYWGTWAGLGMLWLLHRLPRSLLHGPAALLAWLLRIGSPKRRRIAAINLSWCFPELTAEQRDQLLRDHYLYSARSMLDYGMLWFGSPGIHAARIRLVGEEHYQRLHARKIPVIVLAPHSVALDHGGLRMSQLHDGVSFAKPMRNPVVEWINHRSRTRYSGDIFTREQGLRPAIRQIRKGRFFYYLPDEDLGAEGAVFADFFGVPKATLTALGRLARLTGAAVLPSFAFYDAARDEYILKLWPPLEPFPKGDEEVDAQSMNAAIETAIRENPAQYLWTMRIFRTRPGGSIPPYRKDEDTPPPEAPRWKL